MDLITDLESSKTKDLSDPRPRKNYQNIPNKTLPKADARESCKLRIFSQAAQT